MSQLILTVEQGARLEQLRKEYVEATLRAGAAIKQGGMSTEAFIKADAEAGEIVREIRSILGIPGNAWNS